MRLRSIIGRMLSLENHIRLAYWLILHRAPDPAGFQHYRAHIKRQNLPKAFIFEALASSPEYKKSLDPLAYARTALVQRLPHANVIVDFGGSTKHMKEGALYAMGYQQKWKKLFIVDLPSESRDEQWRPNGDEPMIVDTPNGPVEHVRGSMVDRTIFKATGFADMVWSGNAIEHISETEADDFLENVYDVLKQDGAFHLDTPNRNVTRLQFPDRYTNSDHQIEYTHHQLSEKLKQHGFVVEERIGVLDCSKWVRSGEFKGDQLPSCPDFTDNIENGYFLYYKCRKAHL